MSAETLQRPGKIASLAALTLSVVGLCLPLAGCNTKNNISSPDLVLAFSPQSVVTRGLRLQSGRRSGNTFLDVEIVAEGLGDLARLTYDLTYPPDLFRWVDVQERPYLSEDGDVDTMLQTTETSDGVIHVEHSRVEGSPPLEPEIDVGVLAGFGFEGYASGQGTFAVRNIRAFRTDGSEIEDIEEVEARVVIDITNAA